MASTKKKKPVASKAKKPTKQQKTMAPAVAEATKKTSKPAKELQEQPQEQIVAAVSDTQESKVTRLFTWNKWLAVFHAAQGIIILVLSATKTLPITTSFLTPNPLSDKVTLVSGTHHVFDIDLVWLVAIFFFLSAAAHTLMATVYRKRYETDLALGINRLRWIEYSFSASTMMVAIALLSGVYDLSSLLMIFALDLVMNMMGLAMEIYNKDKKAPNWLAYGIGCIAGIVPWIVFAIYVFGANVYGSGHIPGFVYGIYASMFVLFSSFAVNMYLQYKKKGKWADYLYGERMYMILSLVAKTALAWQIFAGALRP